MEYYDCLGHILHIGDNVIFKSGGIMLIGTIRYIQDNTKIVVKQLELFDKPDKETSVKEKKAQYIITPIGFYGSQELRSKLKKEYKINTDNNTICLVKIKYKK
jgi:hypothetical protein